MQQLQNEDQNNLRYIMWQCASSCWHQSDPDIARRGGRQQKKNLRKIYLT